MQDNVFLKLCWLLAVVAWSGSFAAMAMLNGCCEVTRRCRTSAAA
jgi:hypothetical protein